MATKETVEESRASSVLRIPYEVRDYLKEKAAQNGRSMNAEILFRLQQSIKAESRAKKVG